MSELVLKPIAHIETDFPEKFGVPRQSGIVENLKGKIIFTPEYRDISAFRGIDGYSHLWLIWGFSENKKNDSWSPTVRPPKLGGNARIGVFASRSPFRPNPLGLSSVKFGGIEIDKKFGPVLIVYGADIVSGTPIYDIKPYLAYTDSHSDASSGFSKNGSQAQKAVCFQCDVSSLSDEQKQLIAEVLAQDPHPSYKTDPERIYKMSFSGFDISFSADDRCIFVLDIK